MNHDQEINGNSKRFEISVSRAFAFLETEWGMKISPVRVANRKYPLDAYCTVRYEGERVAVDVSYSFPTFEVSVLIMIRDGKGRLSSPNPKQYVYLEPYLDFISSGKVKPITPYTKDYFVGKIVEVVEDRKELLADGFDKVAQGFAERLRDHGKSLLEGDNSDFEEFHRWLGWDTWRLDQ